MLQMKTYTTIHEYYKYSAFEQRHLQHSIIVYRRSDGKFFEAKISSFPIRLWDKEVQKFMRHVPMWTGRLNCIRFREVYK